MLTIYKKRTQRIASNDFYKICDFIDTLLINKKMNQYCFKGSASWFPPTAQDGKQTIIKLCYYNENSFMFGIRKEYTNLNNITSAVTNFCTHLMGVPPQSNVEFLGFFVKYNELDLEKIKNVIDLMPINSKY